MKIHRLTLWQRLKALFAIAGIRLIRLVFEVVVILLFIIFSPFMLFSKKIFRQKSQFFTRELSTFTKHTKYDKE